MVESRAELRDRGLCCVCDRSAARWCTRSAETLSQLREGMRENWIGRRIIVCRFPTYELREAHFEGGDTKDLEPFEAQEETPQTM